MEPMSAGSLDLDVLEGSLRLWMQQYPAEARQVLPVQVLGLRSRGRSSCAWSRPTGSGSKGLDLEGAYQLVEMLRC